MTSIICVVYFVYLNLRNSNNTVTNEIKLLKLWQKDGNVYIYIENSQLPVLEIKIISKERKQESKSSMQNVIWWLRFD